MRGISQLNFNVAQSLMKNGINEQWAMKKRYTSNLAFQTPQSKEAINGIRKIRISPLLQKAFITTTTDLPYLLTYNAVTAHFIYWTNLLHVHGHTFIGKVQKFRSINSIFLLYTKAYYQRRISKLLAAL